jgi:uncharacterized membrane protein YccC
MAKKDKKKKDRKGSDAADAVEAVRSAVERTFQATSEGAAGTQKRTRALVDEIAHAAARVRESLEDRTLLEDLRNELRSLGQRVSALEGRGAKAASTTSAPSPAAAKPKRRPAKRAATAKRAKRAATAKRPAKRAAKRPAKTAAKRPAKTAAKRPATAKRTAKAKSRPAKSPGS